MNESTSISTLHNLKYYLLRSNYNFYHVYISAWFWRIISFLDRHIFYMTVKIPTLMVFIPLLQSNTSKKWISFLEIHKGMDCDVLRRVTLWSASWKVHRVKLCSSFSHVFPTLFIFLHLHVYSTITYYHYCLINQPFR